MGKAALAQQLWEQRGMAVTKTAYTSAPIQTHPNDLYKRVAPDGQYDQVWAGVQKTNALATVGTRLAYLEYNPMQSNALGYPTIQKNGWQAVGPGSYTAQLNQQQSMTEYSNAAQSPPLLGLITGRLGSLFRRTNGGF
jgi:hypothetical protein